ncbi:MAG: PLDc N-terminal domain-containing protein [Actinomycetota bacterium]
MLLLRGLVLVAVLGLWAYSVFDVIRSNSAAVRHLHKLIWLVLVLLVSPIGPVAWLFLGRPHPVGTRLFQPKPGRDRPPDDSPEFLASLDDEIRRRRRAERRRPTESSPADIEEEIRQLEEELRRRSAEEGGEDQDNPR